MNFKSTTALGAAALSLSAALPASAAQVFATDVIVQGSLCVGVDCATSESFGSDTIRLKENNLRIHFDDTSASASFPSNDWRLIANEQNNGGLNMFALQDATAGRNVIVTEAAAQANSIYIKNNLVGFGTSTPAVELHSVDGDTPTLRLEQDGSSGFTAQTWDVAGNETNFFVRDATNGSLLPFKIKPNAPTNSLFVAADGDVGMSLDNPAASLHIRRSTGGFLPMIELENNGPVALIMDNNDSSNPVEWRMGQIPGNTDLVFVTPDSAGDEMKLTKTGDLMILGNFISNGSTLTVPDYVFGQDYELMPLTQVKAFIAENSHLPGIPSAADIAASGLDMTQMQLSLLEKIEELTLYTLAQEERIAELTKQVSAFE